MSFVATEFAWLQQRYAFDAQSRHPGLLEQFLRSFDSQQSYRLVDVGCGFGANFLFLAPRIKARQHWLLLDRDHSLLDKIESFLGTGAQELDREGAQILAERVQEGSITWTVQAADFTNPQADFYQQHWDAVVANAVFDLNSRPQLDSFLEACRKAGVPRFYFTLHLDAHLHFEPADHRDAHYCALFHQHMQRPQAWGRGLGPQCALAISEALLQLGLDPQLQQSPWHILENDQDFLQANLSFFADSLPTLLRSEPERAAFELWLKERRQRIEQAALRLTVAHQDILALLQ